MPKLLTLRGTGHALCHTKFLSFFHDTVVLTPLQKMQDLGIFCMETVLWNFQQAKVRLSHLLVPWLIKIIKFFTPSLQLITSAKTQLCSVWRMVITENLNCSMCKELIQM